MKRFALLSILALIFPLPVVGQSYTLTQISAQHLYDTARQPLNGTIVVTLTDSTDTPVTYTPQGGSPSTATFTANVKNGAIQLIAGFQPFTVPAAATTSPAGIVYRVQTKDQSNVVVWTFPKTAIAQPYYSLDGYIAQAAIPISGSGAPSVPHCAGGAQYTDTTASTVPWACTILTQPDNTTVWTQSPSQAAQCPGMAIAYPLIGNPYCMSPAQAYLLPGYVLGNSSATPAMAQPIIPSGGGGSTPAPPAFAIQIANPTASALAADPVITVNPTAHILGVGTGQIPGAVTVNGGCTGTCATMTSADGITWNMGQNLSIANNITTPHLTVTGCASGQVPRGDGSGLCVTPSGNGTINPGQLALAQYPTASGDTVSQSHFTYDAATGNNLAVPGSVTANTTVPALQPVADVTHPAYGAKGDGTTDDAPAIRSALAAVLAAGGGTIYIPKGTYRLATTSSTLPAHVFDARGSHVHFKCSSETVLDAAPLTSPTIGGIFAFGYPTAAMIAGGGGIQESTGYQANVLTLPGSATITLTTPSDTSHFAVGDSIYILGGPSVESNGDGEINWITAINAGTGVLTLRTPTSKPYTGNNSNVGAPGIVTVIPGVDHSQTPAVDRFFYDESVEGCTVINSQVDFLFMGQVIHGKMLNNHVEIKPTATRGMAFNSYYPMADMEIAGNYYVQGGMWFSQLADGMRDFDIHDNTFVSANGWSVLAVSQGIVGTRVHHNTFNVTFASSVSGGNAAVLFSTAYGFVLDGNIINVSTLSSSGLIGGIITGQSNGVCKDCVISNNIIRFTGPSASGQTALRVFGSNATITGNEIFVNGARAGIQVIPHGTVDYATSTVVGNIIQSYNEVAGYFAINVGDSGIVSPSSEVIVNSNKIYGSGGANGTGILFTAKGGGVVVGNEIYNIPTGIDLGGTGTPLLMANECTSVTTTTNCGSPGFAQTAANNTFSGSNTFTGSNTFSTGTQDFHTSAHTLPAKSGTIASLPATCTIGEEYFATNATPGSNKYGCTSTNVWTSLGGGAGVVTTAPTWLQFLGDGSEGASTCSGTIGGGGGEHWYSSFTVSAGTTCTGSARSTVLRVNGPCTINGTIDVSAVGLATTSTPSFGGSGGGGGGGTGAGAAGAGTLSVPGGSGTGNYSTSLGGTAGAVTGGAGGAGAAVTTPIQKAGIAVGIAGGLGWGGGAGGAGGSSGGAAGNGGENLVLACSSINFGANNIIDASGGPGQPSTANSVGAGGGGGGGVVVIRSSSVTGTPTINLNGGPGGSCTVPMAQWSGGGGVGLTTTATVTTGAISACSVGGTTTGFNSAPKCTIVGGGGTLGTCHFTFSTGTVTGCVVDTAGSGYTQSTFTTCGAGGAGGAGWSKTIAN